jgi:hypothetical protein
MPALPADIAAASRDAVTAAWADAAIAARYPSARDGSVEPADGYFDSVADAQTMIDARGALIGREARRFAVEVADLIWPTLAGTVPCFGLVDAEQAANGTLIAARFELDLESEKTTIELYGTKDMA